MKLRYLVVDDAPFIRELLKSVMNSMGHLCVGEASDAEEAIGLVAATLPDLAFVDLVMPKKNGVTLAHEMRELWPEIFLISCTTLEIADLPKSQDTKVFNAWLSKPFTKENIESILRSIVPAYKGANRD